jgi:hypothetical protein
MMNSLQRFYEPPHNADPNPNSTTTFKAVDERVPGCLAKISFVLKRLSRGSNLKDYFDKPNHVSKTMRKKHAE